MTKKLTYPSRRSLIIGAPALLLARSEIVDAASRGGSPNTWPGQSDNPVGYAASPGYPGALTASAWPPSGWGSGTPGSPNVFKYLDFDAGGGGADFPISSTGADSGPAINYVTFIGCRFQANGQAAGNSINTCVECFKSGSNNIIFSYCSFVPRTSLVTAPPNAAWPASSVGTGVVWTGTPAQLTYQIPFLSGTEFAISVGAPAGGLVTIDHCDMWGMGDGVNLAASTGRINVTDCWIHDCRYDQYPPNPSLNDHTDGVGYLAGRSPPCSNIFISHNTIASIGNTNAIGFQHLAPPWKATTSYSFGAQVCGSDNNAYTSTVAGTGTNTGHNPLGDNGAHWHLDGPNYFSNISIINNYLTGFNNILDAGGNVFGINHMTITDNVFASDLMWLTRLVYSDFSAQFTGTTNVWRRNKLQLYPGSGSSYASRYAPYDGQFVLPLIVSGNVGGSFSRTDWTG
jgi:hypothetical protein